MLWCALAPPAAGIGGLPSAQCPVPEQTKKSKEKKSRSLEHEVCGVDHLVLANGQLGFPH